MRILINPRLGRVCPPGRRKVPGAFSCPSGVCLSCLFSTTASTPPTCARPRPPTCCAWSWAAPALGLGSAYRWPTCSTCARSSTPAAANPALGSKMPRPPCSPPRKQPRACAACCGSAAWDQATRRSRSGGWQACSQYSTGQDNRPQPQIILEHIARSPCGHDQNSSNG